MRVLLTGASGFTGTAVARPVAEEHQAMAVVFDMLAGTLLLPRLWARGSMMKIWPMVPNLVAIAIVEDR